MKRIRTNMILILIFIYSLIGCEKLNLEMANHEHFIKFIGETEELRAISFLEKSDGGFLILVEKPDKKESILNPFDDYGVSNENIEHQIIYTDKFGNQVNNKTFPYESDHIEMRRDDLDEVIICGLAKQRYFYVYNWEEQNFQYIINIPDNLYNDITPNSKIKYYPQHKKILYNIIKWNNETNTEDLVLVLFDFSGNYNSFSFPRKHITEEVYKEWIWDPEGGGCQLLVGIKQGYDHCPSNQHLRVIRDDLYVSFHEYKPDGQILVVYDSIRNDFYDLVSSWGGVVYETDSKWLVIKSIDLNGKVHNSIKLQSSPSLRSFLLPFEKKILLHVVPKSYSWDFLPEDQNPSGLRKGLFTSFRPQLYELDNNLNVLDNLTLSLNDDSEFNTFSRMKMTKDGELLFLYGNTSFDDMDIKLKVFNGTNIKVDFNYGTTSQNEICVDALKTIDGGYAILANIELDGQNRVALIKLNKNGEIVNN